VVAPVTHACPRCGGPATPIIGQYVSCVTCDAPAPRPAAAPRRLTADDVEQAYAQFYPEVALERAVREQVALGAHIERRQRPDGGEDVTYVAAGGARIPLTSGPTYSYTTATLGTPAVDRSQPEAAVATDIELRIAAALQAEEVSQFRRLLDLLKPAVVDPYEERVRRAAQLLCSQPGWNGIAVFADPHCPPDRAYLLTGDTWTLPADAEPPAIAAWPPAGPPQPMFIGPPDPVHGQSACLWSEADALYWVSGDGMRVKIA
jgi:hypothetical protein